jgi:hypothetical protein
MEKNFLEILAISRKTLHFHFNTHETTKNNPYINIDALVWSVALREKTERYSTEVYLFAEYLIKNWEHLNTLNE